MDVQYIGKSRPSLFPSYIKAFASLLIPLIHRSLKALMNWIVQPQLWTSLIISAIHLLLSRAPAKRRRGKSGVMWLEGWPSRQLLFSMTKEQYYDLISCQLNAGEKYR